MLASYKTEFVEVALEPSIIIGKSVHITMMTLPCQCPSGDGSRWRELKKLCNNDVVPKQNEPDYGPTYKYDYIYKCIVHNVNYLSELAELDATLDETTFATASPEKRLLMSLSMLSGNWTCPRVEKQYWCVIHTEFIHEPTTIGMSFIPNLMDGLLQGWLKLDNSMKSLLQWSNDPEATLRRSTNNPPT